MRSVLSVLCVAVALVACHSDDLGPRRIDGVWSEAFDNPGSFLIMNLTLNGSSVSGVGNWCGEAGPCGTLGVTGTLQSTAVHLDLMFTQQIPTPDTMTVSHFDGELTLAQSLEGTLTSKGKPGVHVTFRRPPSGSAG